MKIDKKIQCYNCKNEELTTKSYIVMRMGTNEPIKNQRIVCYKCLASGLSR